VRFIAAGALLSGIGTLLLAFQSSRTGARRSAGSSRFSLYSVSPAA
jgi:hypothetical protein